MAARFFSFNQNGTGEKVNNCLTSYLYWSIIPNFNFLTSVITCILGFLVLQNKEYAKMGDVFKNIFTQEVLNTIFPKDISNDFFDALYGDASEGAYDITLNYNQNHGDKLEFGIQLNQRPGKCLACNLTYGLPEVFSRHPLINIKGVVAKIEELLGAGYQCTGWKLGHTRETSRKLHIVPLFVSYK
jgi:hypothetical protein